MAADTISGYIQRLLDGIEFRQAAYALDRDSRKAAPARDSLWLANLFARMGHDLRIFELAKAQPSQQSVNTDRSRWQQFTWQFKRLSLTPKLKAHQRASSP